MSTEGDDVDTNVITEEWVAEEVDHAVRETNEQVALELTDRFAKALGWRFVYGGGSVMTLSIPDSGMSVMEFADPGEIAESCAQLLERGIKTWLI